ncbi:MAG TPA: hypothetical protein PKH13_01205, partial [Bacillota bacterium]|nr:hypothetical protein [Bacillota bacterium]
MNNIDYKHVIELSHERCRKFNIKEDQVYSSRIINETELQKRFAENRSMILTAAPYMEQLINFVKGHNFFALLTDGEGCILNAIGDEAVVVVVSERRSRQAHRKPELVQPVGQAAVDWDLVAGQSQGLQQV